MELICSVTFCPRRNQDNLDNPFFGGHVFGGRVPAKRRCPRKKLGDRRIRIRSVFCYRKRGVISSFENARYCLCKTQRKFIDQADLAGTVNNRKVDTTRVIMLISNCSDGPHCHLYGPLFWPICIAIHASSALLRISKGTPWFSSAINRATRQHSWLSSPAASAHVGQMNSTL